MAQLSVPITPPMESTGDVLMTLETQDGIALQGYSFGAANQLLVKLFSKLVWLVTLNPSLILLMRAKSWLYPLVGNYGVPDRELLDEDYEPALPKYFESNKIHIAGLVVAHYTEEYSHWLAKSSLGKWLQEQGIPAIYGVDTRSLTKRLREKGQL